MSLLIWTSRSLSAATLPVATWTLPRCAGAIGQNRCRSLSPCVAKLPRSFAGAIIRLQTVGLWFETFGTCRERLAAVTEGVLWDCAIAGLKSGKRRLPERTETETFRRCIWRDRA